MTPAQFASYVVASIPVAANEVGDIQQDFAHAHGPAFLYGVKVASANGQVNGVNPTYCATDDCAQKLLELMKAADPSLKLEIAYADPYTLTRSGWDWFSTTVPQLQLQFDQGPWEDNAGQLALAFSLGQDPARQLRYVIWSLRADAFYFGASSVDPGRFQG